MGRAGEAPAVLPLGDLLASPLECNARPHPDPHSNSAGLWGESPPIGPLWGLPVAGVRPGPARRRASGLSPGGLLGVSLAGC